MAACPKCKQEITKRKMGRCPHCYTPVEMHGGFYYRTEDGSPTDVVVKHFEGLIRKKVSKMAGQYVSFYFPRKGQRWKRELVAAERLLQDTEGDLPLVLETLDFLFTSKEYGWRTRDSLIPIEREFLTVLPVVKHFREQEKLKKTQEQQALKQVLDKEDIFS